MKPFTCSIKRKIIPMLAGLLILALNGCNTIESENTATPTQTFAPTEVRMPPAVAVATQTPEFVPPVTDLPVPTEPQATELPASRTIACPGMLCVWRLDPDPPELVSFEGNLDTIYDYSPATQRVLHGRFTGRGAGPGSVAVTDLQFLDLNSGMSHQIIQGENIVEAVWAPDGQNLAYVRATSGTYELHWLTESGEDQLLASDVAFTFSVSPGGDRVAFTRESNYNVAGMAGLYVVDIGSGEEWSISDIDREGTGSISDRPIWSPDESQIILPASGNLPPPGFVLAAVDGSRDNVLTLAPSIQEIIGRGGIGSNVLWHPGKSHLIGQIYPDMLGSVPNRILSLELDPGLAQIVAADLVLEGEGELVGWAEPGVSVWFWREYSDLIQVPLP